MSPRMKGEHVVLLLINLMLIAVFGWQFMVKLNYEFLIYVSVIIVFLGLIAATINKVDYTPATLVGLTVWSAMHLAGGGVQVGDGRLYDVMLVPLSDRYPIFRYDQLVHIWGFAASTLVAYCLLSPLLQDETGQPRNPRRPVAVGIILVMAGLGMGAFNEIVEFGVSTLVPESGVGGYINTSLDLCADLLGAVFGLIYVRVRYLAG